MSHIGEETAMNLPFDDNKLSALMEDQGADVVLATSKENVRYLLGGYQFFFSSPTRTPSASAATSR